MPRLGWRLMEKLSVLLDNLFEDAPSHRRRYWNGERHEHHQRD
jgi:hypothetical protein